MNKSALKALATSARKELLKKLEAKAMKIGITEDNIKKAEIESSDAIYIDGKQLSKGEKVQRDQLIERINQIGFKGVLEEVAYTWFNRFTALRYMEVNEYLPTYVRVLSSINPDSADPDMIKEALSLDLEIDKEYVYEMKLNNKTEELFKYLIIKHCNDLNRFLPFMFKTIDDYTEILFPEGLLAKDSFIREMINTDVIPEDNWKKVEVIGWLYQYYIAEEKDRVIKAKKKYKTEEIPFATQLFTPDWIVRYMVQNSLGRYWIESHPEHRELLSEWEFYLENLNPERDFEEKLAPYINRELKVEDIKCIDPAMGSGHILVYMFDVLYEIYSKCGYMEREIPRLIIENNLYGLDIDDRAYQLACFSVVMKALEYNKRFFRSIEREGLKLNLASIQETNNLKDEDTAYIAEEREGNLFTQIHEFIDQFKNAKTIGSLLKVEKFDLKSLAERLKDIQNNPAENLFDEEIKKRVLNVLPNLIKQTEIMTNKYDILVTNPPYMGTGSMNDILSAHLRKEYPDSKSDLFSCFMELNHYLKKEGFYASINQHSWMFLQSFLNLRRKIVKDKTISTMLHLGSRAFEDIGGEVVQSTAFVLRNKRIALENGIYIRLLEFKNANEKRERTIKSVKNVSETYRFTFNQNKVSEIPGDVIAYWLSEPTFNLFKDNVPLNNVANAKSGLSTADDNKYLRVWYEVSKNNMSLFDGKKWFPYTKGGSFRKWYGNNTFVVNWLNDGEELKNFKRAVIRNSSYYFKEGITWGTVSASKFSFRYTPEGFIYGNKGNGLFPKELSMLFLLGLVNSNVTDHILKIIAPTMSLEAGYVSKIPICSNNKAKEIVEGLSRENVKISKCDWDSFETSWDFKLHPLIKYKDKLRIKSAFQKWKDYSESQFERLKINEEKINETFIQLYKLENELTPAVQENDVTIRTANLEREIKSLMSYAIGCMFGRYSLDEEGLVFAGGVLDLNRYKTFSADSDNILPVLPGAYFEDDIVSRFVELVKVAFGEENLIENLDFIADTLGKKNGETARETIRRYFLNDFFKEHLQTYKKRPIYWLFTSGKQKAFNCLIYMHRYDKTTLSRIRTDYLHDYQIRLDAERKSLVGLIEGDFTTKEISNAKKELKVLDKKIEELKEFDELLHHMADMQIEIDLDDGVVVNYEKFKGLVAKI